MIREREGEREKRMKEREISNSLYLEVTIRLGTIRRNSHSMIMWSVIV